MRRSQAYLQRYKTQISFAIKTSPAGLPICSEVVIHAPRPGNGFVIIGIGCYENFSGDKSIDYFPRYAASGLKTPEEYGEFTDFFAPLADDLSLARAIALGKSEIAARVEQIQRDKPRIVETLAELAQ